MGFVTGSCCLLHSPIHHIILISSPSQSSCFFSPLRTGQNRRKKGRISACMNQEAGNERNLFARKRAILFVGFSVLPVLNLTAKAFESWSKDGSDLKTAEQGQIAEQKHEGDASQNPFVSLLGGLGILGSGVLGALYTLSLKEKETSDAAIEAMRKNLKEKEAAIVSMQNKFESDLMNEKEVRNQQVTKLREEHQSLASKLKSANDTILGLGKELQKERKVIGELEGTIDVLQLDLQKAREDKNEIQEKLTEKLESLGVLQEKINFLSGEIKDKDDNIQSLSSALSQKEMELEKLDSLYQQLQEQFVGLSSENEELKDKLRKNETELELRSVAVNDLNTHLGILSCEKEESNRKFSAIEGQYNELKSSSSKKAAEDAELLEKQKIKLQQLEQQLESTLSEVSRNKLQVTDLSKERDHLRNMLNVELNKLKSLEQELQITLANLEESRKEASERASQLQLSRDLCLELEVEVSKLRADFAETKETLQKKAEEARKGAEVLAGELTSVKDLLKKKIEEIEIASNELAAVVQTRDDLQKELVDVYKKAESAVNSLNEEKASVASLNKELKALDTRISEEREARTSLERNLEEATRSLLEINQNAVVLSRELELANTQIASLKDALYKSLAEQKQVSQEARENMEDAHSLIRQLGQERESSEKRAKKLEEELSAAKGEILRLRSRINSVKTSVNDQHQQTAEVGAKASTSNVNDQHQETAEVGAKASKTNVNDQHQQTSEVGAKASKSNVNDQQQQTVEVGAKAVAPVKRVTRRRKAVRQKDQS